jgi:hypothetical protein
MHKDSTIFHVSVLAAIHWNDAPMDKNDSRTIKVQDQLLRIRLFEPSSLSVCRIKSLNLNVSWLVD